MKLTHLFCAAIAAVLTVTSCVTTKEVAYLQDMMHESQINLENRFEAVISPYDELTIIVSCFDKELAEPFNLYGRAGSNMMYSTNGNNYMGYLVDQDGNIEMPVLGTIHAAGLTRLKLQERIRQILIDREYITDPYVMVRFQNFKIFFLGSNGGKAISIPEERCTFLQALALSGDLNVFTNRNKIAVMREVDGKMVMRFLDPRSSKVFDDPFFMLRQNDFIITRDRGYKNFMESAGQALTVLGYASTLVGFGTLITSIVLLTKK